jgi:predicted DNA-binding transcriptional regulator YafY
MSKKVRFFQRYSFIINLLSRRKLNVSELVHEISANFQDYNSYSSRTLSRDINDIKEIFGFDINFNRSLGVYEINREYMLDEDIEKQKLLEAFQFFELANIAREYNDILLFEPRKFLGFELIAVILEAIKAFKIITFEYKKFGDQSVSSRKVQPLGLREHNSRWYLIAEEVDTTEKIRKNFGLDRISDIKVTNETFKYPKDFNVKTNFENIYGLGEGLSNKIETVHLLFSPISARYIESLPLHISQTQINQDSTGVLFEYKIFTNQELVREIVKLGAGVKVIKPLSLKQEVIKVLKDTLLQYDI